MSMRKFLKTYSETIDSVIRANGIDGRITNDERELWVLNDEGLYRLAQSAGVKI